MASIIRIKRSSGILAPSTLKTAELAYAYGIGTQANKGDRLFIGTGDNGAGGATSITVIGGSYFTDMLDHVSGTLTASSAIVVDSDKKIDQLLSGNIVIDGATNKISGLVDPTDSSGVATKRYVDNLTQLTGISLTGDSGSDSVNLADSGLNFQGQAGEIHTKITNNNLLISLDSSGVVAGTYGATTAVPIITVDDFGRIDSIGTAPASVTLNISADSGLADSVNLLSDVFNFSGSNSIITKVVDSGIDIRLDSTHQATHLASKGASHPGLYTYGGGTSNARISVDDFGIVKHIDQTNNVAELTIKDAITGNSPTEHKLFTEQNDLVLLGGAGITIGMTGPTHSVQGVADYADGVFTISVDSGLDILKVGGDSNRGWASGVPGAADPNAPSNSHHLLPATFQQAGNAVFGLAKDNAQNFTTVQFFDSEGGNFHMGPDPSTMSNTYSNPIYGVNTGKVVGHWQARNPNYNLGNIEYPWRGTALDKNLDFTAVSGSYMSFRENNDSAFSIRSRNNMQSYPTFTTMVNYNTLDSQIEYHVDQRLKIDKYIYFGDSPSHGYIGKESTDQWLNIGNGGTGIALYSSNIKLASTANTGFKTIEVQGSIKPTYVPGEVFDIGDSLGLVPATHYRTFKDGYFSGTINAGAIQLTSGGISVGSGGNIAADSARFDVIHSRTGQNMTIAPNTDSGGTITIGTRYGNSGGAANNHALDLTNVGLKAGLIKGEAVGTTSLGSWAIPLQSTNLYNDLGFFGGQSHINIRDNADSALTITAMTSLGAATADMMRFNTYDSQVHFHVDQVVDNNKNVVFGSGYIWNNNPVPGRTTMRHDTTDHYFEMLADSHTTAAEFAAKNITLIAYDPAYDFRSGFGGLSGVGNIELDGNVIPALGRGSSLYNQGYRRNLGTATTRFGTVYAGHFNRPQVVDSAVYGSQTSIPVLTINSSGLIDSAGTVPLATTLNINADAGTGDVALLDSSIEVAGGFNVNTRVVDNTVTVHLDSDVLGLTSLTVDNVKIDGNTISSTDNSNQLFIDPFPVGDSGDLVVRGNLIVQGTETTVNSTVVSLNDKNLVLADSAANSSAADGAGITVGGAGYSGTKPQFIFDAATDRWDPNLPFDIPFASLDSAIFFNGVALREVVEDHLDNFFGVDSNAALTLTYDDVQNSMTWKAINATKSQVGVSSFDSANFSVTAGHVAVTVLDGGTY